jgi:hypothetical protein
MKVSRSIAGPYITTKGLDTEIRRTALIWKFVHCANKTRGYWFVRYGHVLVDVVTTA